MSSHDPPMYAVPALLPLLPRSRRRETRMHGRARRHCPQCRCARPSRSRGQVHQSGRTVVADGTWTGTVDLTWQLGDPDAEHSRADVAVLFSPDGDALEIAGLGAADRGRGPLWLRGELRVSPSDGALVLVERQKEADAAAQRVTRGMDVVHRVPSWRSPVWSRSRRPPPTSMTSMTLGVVAAGMYAAIAAVTTTAGSSTGPDARCTSWSTLM